MDNHVPRWLRDSAAVSWRLLVVGAAVFFSWQVLQDVSVVVLSAVIGLFPASLLWGPVQNLKRRGWPPIVATWAVIVVGLMALVGVTLLVVPELIDGLEPLGADLAAAYESLIEWLSDGPFGLAPADVERYSDLLIEQLQSRVSGLGAGLLSGAAAVLEIITGLFLAVIVAFFVLKDGDRIARRVAERMSPAKADRFRRGGKAAWDTLSRYVKGLAIVGLVDSVAIAIGLLILGVPLVFPLAVLVFIGAFFPLVGAFISGLFAVAVALVNGGATDALIVFAIVVAVQQLEGDVILPLVFGRTLQLHPLVVLLAIAIGGVAFGIPGAFLAVPLAAVIMAVDQELSDEPEKSMVAVVKSID
ncbi:MAG TPA: AI-2E family transporter [Acidimicrobiia bacterium]|nr:AI-2E family transporter [Acidimicrobiia bacterium]